MCPGPFTVTVTVACGTVRNSDRAGPARAAAVGVRVRLAVTRAVTVTGVTVTASDGHTATVTR
jgi:hypothetical protein